jgi:ATP-dependent RNA helicase RhlE
VLIFTRTKYRARNPARNLEKHRFRVSALQGNMSQSRRQQAIDGFRDGRYDILVATDIASRGIDVSEISHVINFDMPDTVDAYTHRIGRTGRAHRTGEAFTFMAQGDEPLVREIEKVLGKPIERRRLPGFSYGGTMPENQSQGNRPNQPRRTRSDRKQNGGRGSRERSVTTALGGRN